MTVTEQNQGAESALVEIIRAVTMAAENNADDLEGLAQTAAMLDRIKLELGLARDEIGELLL